MLLDILRLNDADPLLRRRDPLAPTEPPPLPRPLSDQWVERDGAPPAQAPQPIRLAADVGLLPPKHAVAPSSDTDAERRKRADDERKMKAKDAEVEVSK